MKQHGFFDEHDRWERIMRNSIFLIIALTLLNSCSGGKEIITNEEQQVIQAAFIDPANSRKTQAAFDILDQRIIKHHKKTDYAIKIQLLLSSEQFNMDMPTINEVLQRYPDYVEMYAAGCALSLQQNDRKMAQDYYQNAIDFYQKQLDDKADKLPIFDLHKTIDRPKLGTVRFFV
jgi:tetratricopeptide (TPR) repeat protein